MPTLPVSIAFISSTIHAPRPMNSVSTLQHKQHTRDKPRTKYH